MLIHNAPFDIYAKYVVWGAFFQIPFIFASVMLRAQERPRLFVILGVSQFLCLTALVLYYVIVLKQGVLGQIRGVFYTYFIFAIISALILVMSTHFRPQGRHIRESLSFAFPIFLTYIIGFFVSRANVLILQYFVVGGSVGVFALGVQISGLIPAFSGAFEKAWVPFIYSLKPDRVRIILAQYMRIAVPSFMLIAMGMGLFAPEILRIVSSANYASAWRVVAITSIGTAMAAISGIPVCAIYYDKRSDIIAWITAATAVISIILNIVLIPRWGMFGAVFSSSVMGFVTLIFSLWGMQRYSPILLNYSRLVSAISLGIIVLFVGAWGGLLIGISLFASLAVKFATMLCYLILLWLLGIFPSEEDPQIIKYLKNVPRSFQIKCH